MLSRRIRKTFSNNRKPLRLLFAVMLIASLPVSAARAGETQQIRLFPEAKQIALPELSDGMGWKQPMYYSTIQTADIDGDGQSEVLARWIDGLNVYRFENGTLLKQSRISALSDNAGFGEPSWYATIQTAVLDTKLRQADVIARERDGIHVFRYERKKHEWRELGPHALVRPFADLDAGGTDWTQPKHYLTIQTADLTGDGVAELVGRGRHGMQVWSWDSAGESWDRLSAAGELTDDQGFDQEAYYYSIQLVDVDHDGAAELVARAPTGIQTYKWSNGEWTMVSGAGPFGDDAGFLGGQRYKSVRASVDATGRSWLYGLAAGTAGAGSGAIQVYGWKDNQWRSLQTLALPGSGWDRESQFATLMAANIEGDAEPEFLVRGPRGLYAYTLSGRPLPVHSQSFTDAQGWNLTEQYGTLHAARATLTENGESHRRTLILGRGSKGLEVYKFTGQWANAAESNFPQYCTNFNTDSSPKCLAYKAISSNAILGQVDIRSQYTQASYHKGFWTTSQRDVHGMSNPNGPNTDPSWKNVHSEMVQELGYVATVRGWFDNNFAVLNGVYGGGNATSELDQAVGDVDFATYKSVVAKWLEMAGDIVAGLARFTEGGGKSISLILTILKDTFNNLEGSNGDINEEIEKIRTDLNDQANLIVTTNATEQTGYLTDYSKLQQIGHNKATGGYDWSDITIDDESGSVVGSRWGMLINFYKTLIPYKWFVYWCDGNGLGGAADCSSIYTQTRYDCHYGTQIIPSDPYSAWTSEAYIYAGAFYKVNWGLADKLTGTGTDDLNAIWYMMLLGGDLGWDIPQFGLEYGTGYLNYPDPHLAYDNIKYGYTGPGRADAGCNGNGSTTGILSGNQTLSQRLTIAQHNTRHITATEANGILEEIRTLKQEAKAASPDHDVEIDLTSPLREAAKLIERAKLPTRPGQEGSVSATTPTHLAELFVRRVQLHTGELGQERTEYLLTRAYDLIAALEGEVDPTEAAVSKCTHYVQVISAYGTGNGVE